MATMMLWPNYGSAMVFQMSNFMKTNRADGRENHHMDNACKRRGDFNKADRPANSGAVAAHSLSSATTCRLSFLEWKRPDDSHLVTTSTGRKAEKRCRNDPCLFQRLAASGHQGRQCNIYGTTFLRINEPAAAFIFDLGARSFNVIVEEVFSRWPVTIHLNSEAFEYRLVNDSAQEIGRKRRPLPRSTASSRHRAVKLASDVHNGTEAYRSINPVKAVAYDSAVQAALSFATPQRKQDLLLLNVAPFSLSIKTAGPPSPAYEGRGYFRQQYPQRLCLFLRKTYRQDESTNDKGRLSKEADDNPVEPYAYNLRNSHDDEELADNFATAGKWRLDTTPSRGSMCRRRASRRIMLKYVSDRC
ncbi:hypothetical protein B0H19DRAFT_1066657 [Mycena capillaripes]|nr:hypothetical protein B0H19DRAFT_1066657 [Mycena capillaripes]